MLSAFSVCTIHASLTWPLPTTAGSFVVNVPGHHQQDLTVTFGSRCGDRFAAAIGLAGRSGHPADRVRAYLGAPRPSGSCTLEAGHCVVIGRVTTLGEPSDLQPLLSRRMPFHWRHCL
ncbi:flavin reductase [Amycolatopsis panacis]|uniref:Flavin reductase n=1 Tax=Amycolatopsis panacis TaxID=2340917 RepID=A0A419I1H4_9PSEU|nr:flavin reductase [Amycolatopsis panacis]